MGEELDTAGGQFHPDAEADDKLVGGDGRRQLDHAGFIVLQSDGHAFEDLVKGQGDDDEEAVQIRRGAVMVVMPVMM